MVQVIAHRGARSLAPENTLAAAQLAFDLGADLWETDVRMTRDGHPVLFHDETLLRCTDVASRFPSRRSDPVSTFTLAEIQSLDAGSYYQQTDPFGQIAHGIVPKEQWASCSPVRIPTLEQGLNLTRKNNWRVNFELKASVRQKNGYILPEKTLEKIAAAGLSGPGKPYCSRVVISSFYHPWLDWIAEKNPGIEIQALVGENDDDPLDFEDFRFFTYNVNAKLATTKVIAALKARGKKINLFTVNDEKAFHVFLKMGVDGVFTDFPQRFLSPG